MHTNLLIYVWYHITFSTNKDEILAVLNQEINNGICMCFTGRLTRLLNTLVDFYDDIKLQISDQLMEAVRKELYERQYSETVINEWLDNI